MDKLWLKNQWQNCESLKTYFQSNRSKIRFQKKKTKSVTTLWTAGSDLNTYKGPFEKLLDEGVSTTGGRWISCGRLGLDPRGDLGKTTRTVADGGDFASEVRFLAGDVGDDCYGQIGLGF